MAEQPTRWGRIEEPAGREVRFKRRRWAIGDIATRKGIAIVFGDDDSHARLIECAPELLAMVRRYASECADCHGTGFSPLTTDPTECWACKEERALITKATGDEVPQ